MNSNSSIPWSDISVKNTLPGAWSIEFPPVNVDPCKVLRIHGYRHLDKVRPVIKDAAEEFSDKAQKIMTPKVHACRVKVANYDRNKVVLETGTEFKNIDFEQLLQGAQSIVAMVLTVGEGLDKAVIEAIEKFEPLEALFLETAGWLGVEAATKTFVQNLQSSIRKEGKRLTRRIGPGYTYNTGQSQTHWPLEQQKDLFQIFEGMHLPVKLLDSCAMLPKMSRSGLYGIASLN